MSSDALVAKILTRPLIGNHVTAVSSLPKAKFMLGINFSGKIIKNNNHHDEANQGSEIFLLMTINVSMLRSNIDVKTNRKLLEVPPHYWNFKREHSYFDFLFFCFEGIAWLCRSTWMLCSSSAQYAFALSLHKKKCIHRSFIFRSHHLRWLFPAIHIT